MVDVHRQIADLLHAIPTSTAQEVSRLGLIGALRQVAASEFDSAFDEVTWQISPEVDACLPALSPLATELVFYAAREVMRNAARHARPANASSSLHLQVTAAWHAGLNLTIEDDGVGISLSGEPAGQPNGDVEGFKRLSSGQGLALHSTMLAVVGGSLVLESLPGRYTRVRLNVPVS